MEQLALSDLKPIDLKKYIQQTHIIENNIVWLLKSFYYCGAIVNHNYLCEKLDISNDIIDRDLYFAMEQFLRLNKTNVIITLFKLLCDKAKRSYTLPKHFTYIQSLYCEYGKSLLIEEIDQDEAIQDIQFARHKFAAHSENIGIEEFKSIDILKYDKLINEIVSKYNQSLLTGSVYVKNKAVDFVPITMEMRQDTLLSCNHGVAAMLSIVHNR